MRFALIISLFFSLSLTAYGQSPTPLETPAPVVAATPDPMDPKYQPFYPRNGMEEEVRNPGGGWGRGPYGRMHYHPPVRKHATATNNTTTGTATTVTTTRPDINVTTRVTVNIGVTPEGDVMSPGTTTATTTAPKKASAPWNWGWLWASLKFLGVLLLLAAVAVGVWAVGRHFGGHAAATTGVVVAILGILVWLAL